MTKWIECSTGLPDSDETVMVYAPADNEPVCAGYHNGINWVDVSGITFDQGVVTHWMPLPDPPVAP